MVAIFSFDSLMNWKPVKFYKGGSDMVRSFERRKNYSGKGILNSLQTFNGGMYSDNDGCSPRGKVQIDAIYQRHNMTPLVMANEVRTGSRTKSFPCRLAGINGLPKIAYLN